MSLRGFINRLLGRSEPPQRQIPIGPGVEHDDWKAGDLAGCITSGAWYLMETGQQNDGPKFGDVLRVASVAMDDGWHMLEFESWFGQRYTAIDFIKIRPSQTDACTEAFKRQMKDCRPKVDA